MADRSIHGGLVPDQSHPAAARLRKRRHAETRLKIYGLAAILFAVAALCALLSSVVFKAGAALTETYISLDIVIDAEELELTAGPEENDIRRADFAGLARDRVRDYFPQVTKRGDRRDLKDLLSIGASFELAEHIAANPGLLNQNVTFDFLASDIADLYLKGAYGKLLTQAVSGRLTVEEQDKQVRLSSTAPDFAAALETLKRGLIGQANGLRARASLQEAGVQEFMRRLDISATDEDRETAQRQIDARSAARDQLLAQATDLEARATAPGGTEAFSEDVPPLLIQVAGGWIRLTEVSGSQALGEVLAPLNAEVVDATDWTLMRMSSAETARKVSDKQIVWIETLRADGRIKQSLNTRFLTAGDSREPELAGIWGAAVGSLWTMLVTFSLAFPIGVMAAIYLEEYAKKNAVTDFIEVNINNLAAVPSIVFGLLGLAAFIQFFGAPRSAPLVGGLVLALMTLPTIIIASRVAIAAVPPSIRDAALGVGASRTQTTFHHVLPLAMPGILTGTILGMARALGETAPLILIGMVAFIVDIPGGITDSATVLPVQIFRWSDFPERAFEARTAAAICVLLLFLAVMNALAVILRRRYERRW